MNKKEIFSKYQKKINIYKKHNQAYYENSNPNISDKEYDDLKNKILELERDYKFLHSKDSPSITVGYKPSKNFKKSLHKIPMLSLGNAFTEEDLKNFEKKNNQFFISSN